MKLKIKLTLSTLFALMIASMVILIICYQSAPVSFVDFCTQERVEETRGKATADMTDAAGSRVTMLRGFAFTLGRRCRVWRKSLRGALRNVS